MADLSLVGPRLRAARLNLGWTLADLGARTGISVSTISRLEAGKRDPSLSLLVPLTEAIGIRLDDLVDTADRDPRVDRETLHNRGVAALPLSKSTSSVQVFRVRYPAKMSRPPLRTHSGIEWCYTISGVVELTLGSTVYLLHEGEAAEFDTAEPHAFRSHDGAAEALSIFSADGERVHLHATENLDSGRADTPARGRAAASGSHAALQHQRTSS